MEILNLSNEEIKELFKIYLINAGLAVVTPSGLPSTVFDYMDKIEKVIYYERYRYGWKEVVINIEQLVIDYDWGGRKQDFGKIKGSIVLPALKKFNQFVKFSKYKDCSELLQLSYSEDENDVDTVKIGDVVIWEEKHYNEVIRKRIVKNKKDDINEILVDSELDKRSIGKKVGEEIEVNGYKYIIKEID